jgi:hypothetical protein
MKGDKNHMNYSTDYLRKYLNGELTDKEMQAVEKAALEDPFLSDAIDGLEESAKHSSSFETDVADLQSRITERVREHKRKRGIVFMFPRWQVAASIVIIVAITTLTITLLKNTGTQNPISQVNKKDTQQLTVHAAPGLVQSSADTIKLEKQTESREVTPITKSVAQNKTTMANKPPLSVPIMQADEQDKTIVASKPQTNVARFDKEVVKKEDTLNYVPEIVLNDSSKAIVSTSVSLSGKAKGVAIDTNVSNQLNEVVVTGYATQRKRDVTGSVTTVKINSPQPQGWQALNNYINENKKINDADSVLKGEEIISFEVNKKSKLSSFKVIKSISSSHDAEVIRLLKLGPPLQTANGKKQKYQISIFFN